MHSTRIRIDELTFGVFLLFLLLFAIPRSTISTRLCFAEVVRWRLHLQQGADGVPDVAQQVFALPKWGGTRQSRHTVWRVPRGGGAPESREMHRVVDAAGHGSGATAAKAGDRLPLGQHAGGSRELEGGGAGGSRACHAPRRAQAVLAVEGAVNVLITVVVVAVTVLLGAEGGHLCAAASQVFIVHLSDVILACAGGIAAWGFHRLVVVLHHHLLVVLRVVRVLHHHRLAHSQPWHQALPLLFLLFLPPFRIWVRKRLHAANCTFLFHFGSVLRRQAGPAT